MTREKFELMDADAAARRLLRATLQTPFGAVQLVEVEAYSGADDPGSHAFRGRTPRNEVMFGPAGHAYVYLCYGTHWMLNVVARPAGEPAALLIRAARPLSIHPEFSERRPLARKPEDLMAGPGNVCRALAINRSLYGADLFDPRQPYHLEFSDPVEDVWSGVRVGINPGCGDELVRRYIDWEHAEWASRPRPKRPTR